MIVAYCGLPGTGKTYAMSQDILREMKRRDAYTNYPMKGAHYFTDFAHIAGVRKGVIGVDEMHMLAPSHGWQGLPQEYLMLWSQARHMGVDFWYTTQSFHRVDIRIRCVTNFVWIFRKVFGSYHVGEMYDAVDIERDRARARPIKTRRFFITKKGFSIYDTMHIVRPAGHIASGLLDTSYQPEELPVFGDDLAVPDMPENIEYKNTDG